MYEQSRYAVRGDLIDGHAQGLNALTRTGTWWTGRQRAVLVDEARSARAEAGLQAEVPATIPDEDNGSIVPSAAIEVVRKVAVAPESVERNLLDDALAAELAPGEYVEAVAITAIAAGLDTFSRGIGLDPVALPEPEVGTPSRQVPEKLLDEGCWLPTIPAGRRGGETGKNLYSRNPMAPNSHRALSFVPADARTVIDLIEAQYVVGSDFMNFEFNHDPDLDRDQIELIAGRVSALNACFY